MEYNSADDNVRNCDWFYFSIRFFYRNVCCIRRDGRIESSINRKRYSKPKFLGARDWPFGSALSIIVVLFSVLLIYLYYRATKVYKYNENGGE
ncbi:Spermidine/putrescine transport system permease protein potB [Bacillus thuringiensis serovar israelensis ATCC 35646]|nr:Spermidine/putrescine transport system permease protein potB [Bacillus thuringiensis serovar israelensis ATCC 35646]